MKYFLGVFSLFVISIDARGAPKIEIFEILDNGNGIELKNLNSNPNNYQRSESLIKVLQEPKPDNQATKFAKQLLNKLKSLRGQEKRSKFRDDSLIYVLNSDVLDSDSSKEEIFMDKTRNEPTHKTDTNELKEVLLQLLKPELKLRAQKKKKLRPHTLNRPLSLRIGQIEDRTMIPRHNRDYD